MAEALLYSFLSVFLLILGTHILLAIAKRIFKSFTKKKVSESAGKVPRVVPPLEDKLANNNYPDFNNRKKGRTFAVFIVVLIIIILISLMGGAFYWYELRTASIRQKCSETAKVESDKLSVSEKYWFPEKYETKKEQVYNDCLHSNGL